MGVAGRAENEVVKLFDYIENEAEYLAEEAKQKGVDIYETGKDIYGDAHEFFDEEIVGFALEVRDLGLDVADCFNVNNWHDLCLTKELREVVCEDLCLVDYIGEACTICEASTQKEIIHQTMFMQ